MKIKAGMFILLIFVFIFGAISIVFVLQNNEPKQTEVNIGAVLSESFKEIISKIGSTFKSLEPSINISPTFFSKCKFEKDFICLNYLSDKTQQTLLLNLKSKINGKIIVYEVQVSGDIVCNKSEEMMIEPFGEFYVKLENCEFNDTRATLVVSYHKVMSSPEFGRTAQATLIILD